MWRTLAFGCALVATAVQVNAQPAQPGGPPLSPPAGPSNCADFRQKIIAMEAPGEIRPPGWFQLDLYLRQLYQTDCIDHPTRQPPKEYWYRTDGTSTGVPADDKHGRPTDGAYTTTQEIGDYCLKQAGTLIPESRGTGKVRAGLSPSICAMAGNLRQACAQPVDDQERRQCATILGDTKASLPPPGAALPPMQVGLDGGPYTLTSTCSALLGRLSGDPNADQAPAEEKGRWLQILNNECPDFLAALERRAGATPGKDPSTFWPAVAGLILNGFPPPGGRNLSTADINADPGFQHMCGEARTNQQKCVDRFNNIASFGSNPGSIAQASGDSQRGAFAECARLYGNVLQMCQATGSVAPRVLARLQPPPPPKPAPPPQPAKPSGGDSRPPPQQPQMSAQCQQLVSNYVAAAQAHDGPRALAGYNALKGAGGCGVLAKVDRPMPQPQAAPADDPRFVARGATPLSDQVVGGCDAAPAECQRRVQQLRAGVSPEAQAAIFMNAVSIGLQLGATMASGMAATMPQGGGGTNMNSIGNRPVQHTYGQGAPAYRAPRNSPSDITGTK